VFAGSLSDGRQHRGRNKNMPGLPKIALARLKANPKSANTSLGPDTFQGDHPDANLIAAFVERTLTERERTQVLNHLSQCAECREVAAFTLPAEEAVVEPTHVAVPRRWNPWPFFRWTALAAVLGTLSLVVVLHPGMRKGRQEVSRLTPHLFQREASAVLHRLPQCLR